MNASERDRERHRPKHHKAADFDQIIIAKELFEWWWRVGTPQVPHDPSWDECLDHIQAFWMDGAWQVLSLKVTTLTGRLHR